VTTGVDELYPPDQGTIRGMDFCLFGILGDRGRGGGGASTISVFETGWVSATFELYAFFHRKKDQGSHVRQVV